MLEYLELFSDEGAYTVSVKIPDGGSIRNSRLHLSEITSLFDSTTGDFFQVIEFDEHPYKLASVHIDNDRKKVTLKLRALSPRMK